MARGADTRADEPVHRVAPFSVPDTEGGWPCGLCGDLFPIGDSWRITLARSGTVIACPSCARDARRRGSRGSPREPRRAHRRADHRHSGDVDRPG